MDALRRKVRINNGPIRPLDLNVMCDQYSTLRQTEAAERRAREKV